MQIDSDILSVSFPPFMLQTIVENAVKHGISSRIEGGTISIQAQQVNQYIQLTVKNSGQFKEISSGDGIGIANTQKRLQLMYGDEASFAISQIDDEVVVQIKFPNQTQSMKI